MAEFQLFHVIADAECAKTRKWILDSGSKERVDFRNITTGVEAVEDFKAYSSKGKKVPLLIKLSNQEIFEGYSEIVKALTR